MKKVVIAHLTSKKEASGRSYADIGARCAMSDSKLQRIFSGQQEATVSDINDILSKGLDSDPRELWALCGMQEWNDSADVGYKGAAELIPYYKEQLEKEAEIRNNINAAFTSSIEALKEAHVEDLEQRDDRYEVAVKHLRTEFLDAKANLQAALKSVKWWRAIAVGMVAFFVLLALLIAYDLQDLNTGLSGLIIRMIREGNI